MMKVSSDSKSMIADGHSPYQTQRPFFQLVKARILKILHEHPTATCGLTYKQIEQLYQNRWRHRPRIPNRVRELRKEGLVRTEIKRDLHGRKRVHVFLVKNSSGDGE